VRKELRHNIKREKDEDAGRSAERVKEEKDGRSKDRRSPDKGTKDPERSRDRRRSPDRRTKGKESLEKDINSLLEKKLATLLGETGSLRYVHTYICYR